MPSRAAAARAVAGVRVDAAVGLPDLSTSDVIKFVHINIT